MLYNQRVADSKQTTRASDQQPNWRAIEFFAGIGGFACAWPECDIVVAIDIDLEARNVYRRNWSHPYLNCEIGSLEAERLAQYGADLWWMSPPCQPYSSRGRQRDILDARAASLNHLLELIPQLRPRAIALENVIGFKESHARCRLENTLSECGYHIAVCELCPTQLGWPNRRPRFYMLASLVAIKPWLPLPNLKVSLWPLLATAEPMDEAACAVDPCDVEKFGSAMDRIEYGHEAVTACFGSSYGKSLLHSGSYLVLQGKWRRFTPAEVVRLLGFPSTFILPSELTYRRAWKLLGNSLSIPAVRYVLAHLSGGPKVVQRSEAHLT